MHALGARPSSTSCSPPPPPSSSLLAAALLLAPAATLAPPRCARAWSELRGPDLVQPPGPLNHLSPFLPQPPFLLKPPEFGKKGGARQNPNTGEGGCTLRRSAIAAAGSAMGGAGGGRSSAGAARPRNPLVGVGEVARERERGERRERVQVREVSWACGWATR